MVGVQAIHNDESIMVWERVEYRLMRHFCSPKGGVEDVVIIFSSKFPVNSAFKCVELTFLYG